MRPLRTLSLVLLSAALAPAGDTYTQKPEVAPSVVRGDPPPAPSAVQPGWAQKFAAAPVPFWIWGPDPNKQYVLRKEFVRGSIKEARVRFTCDNRVRLFFNDKLVGASDEWQNPVEADVTKLLKPGDNVFEAEVTNDGGPAGFVFQMVAVRENGEVAYVVSDSSWTVSEKRNDPKGPPAKQLAKYGDQPWGTVLDGPAVAGPGARVPPNVFQTLPGYQVEKLFTVPKNELGSWVCMTFDNKGRIIASDQEGKGLCRITPPRPGTNDETKVERLNVKITAAQGLLFHDGTLYVVCNGGPGSGLYRVRDTDGDDQFDEVVKLKAINGGGEHGPHAIRLGPDGKSIYVVCGNHTQPPQNLNHSRVPRNWGEDHLLPRNWDANGHARGILAPGGYVAKTDLDGKTWEIFTSGYRNPYDFAFNADGEMFVYDADMEWDMGMPWYRPTRVNHATSGSELGWRSGTGKWPAYYVDSLPAMVDVGPGSPVGVEFGYGTRFPAKYQKALFCCDWTFGTIYAMHLEPNGSTYAAVKEEFLSRTPLPLTDICVGADGALYFVIGGRGTQSELFRVRYVGKEPTEKTGYQSPGGDLRELRRKIEAFHAPAADPEKAVEFVYPYLAHDDRFIRYAARVALEHQPVKFWQGKVLAERHYRARIEGVVALARQGDKSLQPQLLAMLGRFRIVPVDFEGRLPPLLPSDPTWYAVGEDVHLDLLRAYQLVFIRTGEPDKETAAKVLAHLDREFPSKSDKVNRELIQVLVYLKSPTILPKTIELLKQPSKPLTAEGMEELLARNRGYGGSIANMLKNAPDLQKLHYAFVLRNVKEGWTLEHRKVFFGFLNEARTKSGGASYQGFINQIDNDAFANATDADRLAIEAAGLRKPYRPKALPKPLGPGREWTTADLVALEAKLQKGRNFKNGERAYAAARCVVCHRFGGDGGATGPDLTQVAGRFTLKDLAESIVEPSKVVSDQYRASVVTTVTGKTVTGQVVSEVNGKLVIVTDPEDSTKVVEVPKDEVETIKPSAVSLMPEKLINVLNEDEVLDLLAYLLSRGDPNHPTFKK
jgi:putative heme-binding domain-containing protein